jgi:hypothetical protein
MYAATSKPSDNGDTDRDNDDSDDDDYDERIGPPLMRAANGALLQVTEGDHRAATFVTHATKEENSQDSKIASDSERVSILLASSADAVRTAAQETGPASKQDLDMETESDLHVNPPATGIVHNEVDNTDEGSLTLPETVAKTPVNQLPTFMDCTECEGNGRIFFSPPESP